MALDQEMAIEKDAEDLVIAVEYPGKDGPEYVFYLYVRLQPHLVRRTVAELPAQPQVREIARRIIEFDPFPSYVTELRNQLKIYLALHFAERSGDFVGILIDRIVGAPLERDAKHRNKALQCLFCLQRGNDI